MSDDPLDQRSLSLDDANEPMETLKTPQKSTSRKFRPKVVKEVKINFNAQTPTKHVVDGPKRKALRRKYVWKKEVSKDQESTRVDDAVGETSNQARKLCRQALDFEPENGENQLYSGTKHADETKSAPTPIKKKTTGHGRVQKTCSINKYLESLSFGISNVDIKKRTTGGRWDTIDTPIKKRTTSHARLQKMCSVKKLLEVSKQLQAECYSSQNYKKKILFNTRVSSSKNKRSTKSENTQTTQKPVVPNPPQFSALSTDINMKKSETVVVPYSIKSQKNEIILFSSGAGAMVRSTPIKKQPARPKVELDTETGRVWNLLMKNNNSECIDGSNEQKAKWWEEERNMYEARAISFISRMHLVQGNRRFASWKGSVVDSVVGVFLTQNVSDHLSSSAFMNLVAKFPAQNQISVTLNNTKPDEGKDYSVRGDIITADTVSLEEFKQNYQYDNTRKEVGFSNHRDDATLNAKGKKVLKEEKEGFDWDSLRREVQGRNGKREKTKKTMDSVDWEAIRMADVSEVAEIIKIRGMNHKLAKNIQGFLDRLVTEHEGIDLEWLRDASPDNSKEFLLSFEGLGIKSVECVRLLTLHQLAFPVDTNVARIAVRLGWVPLQPLPESLQLHLLDMYPMLESIQKYLWPRLCKLDQKTLYELHYQMITFGKVFCTKRKPNCNACPMRGECRHFASAFASAKLALPGTEKGTPDINPLPLHLREPLQKEQEIVKHSEPANKVTCCEPIIEEPASPEPECAQVTIADIEDAFFEDPEEIPTIRLNMDAFTSNLKKLIELQDRDMSTALVTLNSEAASIPMPKLKNISRLRTEHQVYELPDWHPLLRELEKREPDDPCSYLLAIWTPGETADSFQPAISKCSSQESGELCDEEVCLSCNNIKEAKSQTVRGTILIPCKTAMRGSFPLNGTYFQVNEVFADHDSSLNPIDVPRDCLWDLTKKTVFFGTSVSSIFRGLSTEKIQRCFWEGYVCVKGFDRKTRAPKPLMARLHFPASKMRKGT